MHHLKSVAHCGDAARMWNECWDDVAYVHKRENMVVAILTIIAKFKEKCYWLIAILDPKLNIMFLHYHFLFGY